MRMDVSSEFFEKGNYAPKYLEKKSEKEIADFRNSIDADEQGFYGVEGVDEDENY